MREKQYEKGKQNGIAVAKAKNVKFGRPKVQIPQNFKEVYSQWKNGEITATKGIELTGLKRNKFYDFIKEIESNVITI